MASRYCVVRASDLKEYSVSRRIVTGCSATQIFASPDLFKGFLVDRVHLVQYHGK